MNNNTLNFNRKAMMNISALKSKMVLVLLMLLAMASCDFKEDVGASVETSEFSSMCTAVGFVEAIVNGDTSKFSCYSDQYKLHDDLLKQGVISMQSRETRIFFAFWGMYGDVLHGPFSKSTTKQQIAMMETNSIENLDSIASYLIKWRTKSYKEDTLSEWNEIELRLERKSEKASWKVVAAKTQWK